MKNIFNRFFTVLMLGYFPLLCSWVIIVFYVMNNNAQSFDPIIDSLLKIICLLSPPLSMISMISCMIHGNVRVRIAAFFPLIVSSYYVILMLYRLVEQLAS